MFAGLAVEQDEFDEELSTITKQVELTVDEEGFLGCEGRECGVLTPGFCECEGACYVGLPDSPAPVAEDPKAIAPTSATLVRRFMTLHSRNPAAGSHLMAEATKMFPNPEGSEFVCPFKVSYAPHVCGYIIAAYATTMEAADELLQQFLASVEIYVARRETYINVTNVKPEILSGFFREKNYRKLGPYTFNLFENDMGVFIQIGREKVKLLAYSHAEYEFVSIYHFLTLLNSSVGDVHILNVLSQMSPAIDIAVKERKAAFKAKDHAHNNRRSRHATLADFFAHI